MSVIDRVRRVVTVLLVAAFLLVAPQIAFAGFSTPKTSGLSVGAATMVAPSALTGSYSCYGGLFARTEGVDISLTGFADAGPTGAVYDISLDGDATPVTITGSSKRSGVLRSSKAMDYRQDTWTLTVVSRLGGWTSAQTTISVDCSWLNANSGAL